MTDPRAEAESLFRAEHLECPATDPGQPLVRIGTAAFATRALARDLDDFETWVAAGASEGDPYRAFGFAGHGVASQAVHCYVLTGLTAVAIQVRWASAFGDADEARTRYRGLVKSADTLERTMREAREAGHVPPGRRLAVAHSDFHGSRWAWIDEGATPDWQVSRTGTAMVDALLQAGRLRGAALQR